MIRFYAVQIFDILKSLGYDWFFRMDDDSFIHSKIEYNLFKFMADKDYKYGYRVAVKEPERTSFGFSEMILAYLKAERIKPQTFLENFDLSSKVNNQFFGFKGKVKKQIASVINRLSEKINHDLNHWPPPTEWNRIGFYNNFFITDINFWLQPEVQSLIKHFDRTGGIYKYRWNDLIFQTAAVQIFLPASKVHKFTDWTYEHATIRNGKLDWGGIYPGEGDENNPAVKAFREEFGKTQIKNSY
jgi:alpha 1,2-mannosyltransferase